MTRAWLTPVVAALALSVLSACAPRPTGNQAAVVPPPVTEPAPSTGSTAEALDQFVPEPTAPPAPPPLRARLLVVGDLLMHLPLVQTSAKEAGAWDFTPIFEPVRPWIEGADLAIANLETTLAGTRYPWTGYPTFNSPPEFARDLKAVGFDTLLRANNHALDYGEYGLEQTSAALDRYGIPFTGASRSQAERDRILVVDVAPSIRLAIVNYSYGTNGIPLPHPYSVNILDPDQVAADIRAARALPGVDLVAFAPHMGEEYAHDPSPDQERFFNLALEAGADMVLGNHPHVIQRVEVRNGKLIIYSLGNFVSNQVGLPREEGLMLLLDIVKEGGKARIEQVAFIPTLVHAYWSDGVKRYRILPVEKGLQDFESGTDPLITRDDYTKLQQAWKDTIDRAVGSPEVKVLGVGQTSGNVNP